MAGTVESVLKMMLIGSTERSYKTSAALPDAGRTKAWGTMKPGEM
jgi:hypothetical protein